MSAFIDLTGRKFGRLTAMERVGSNKNKRAVWLCKCDCGKTVTVDSYSLKSGNTKSCGCLNTDVRSKRMTEMHTKHGESKTRLYKIWRSMLSRCMWENPYYYDRYGGRGISICGQWMEYEPFRDWALSNGYSDDLSIDRMDVNGNYCPENCRWADRKTQGNNKRNNVFLEYGGGRKTIAQWANETGILPCTIWRRLKSGWAVDKALTVVDGRKIKNLSGPAV